MKHNVTKQYGFVYAFFPKRFNSWDCTPIYIGSTTNLIQRLRDHLVGKWATFKGETVYGIGVAYVGDEKDCREIETALIFNHKPQCNSTNAYPQPKYKNLHLMDLANRFSYFTRTDFLADETVAYKCLFFTNRTEG